MASVRTDEIDTDNWYLTMEVNSSSARFGASAKEGFKSFYSLRLRGTPIESPAVFDGVEVSANFHIAPAGDVQRQHKGSLGSVTIEQFRNDTEVHVSVTLSKDQVQELTQYLALASDGRMTASFECAGDEPQKEDVRAGIGGIGRQTISRDIVSFKLDYVVRSTSGKGIRHD